MADAIQKSLAGRTAEGAGLTFFTTPAQHVGGDYYDYIRLRGTDRSRRRGRGGQSRGMLLMAQLPRPLRGFVWRRTDRRGRGPLNLPCMRVCGDGRFVTFVVGVIDLATLKRRPTVDSTVAAKSERRRTVGEAKPVWLGVFDKPIEEAVQPLILAIRFCSHRWRDGTKTRPTTCTVWTRSDIA